MVFFDVGVVYVHHFSRKFLKLLVVTMKCAIGGPCIKYVRKISRKTNISNPLIRMRSCAYQGVRNVSFSEDFAYVLNGWILEEGQFNENRNSQ